MAATHPERTPLVTRGRTPSGTRRWALLNLKKEKRNAQTRTKVRSSEAPPTAQARRNTDRAWRGCTYVHSIDGSCDAAPRSTPRKTAALQRRRRRPRAPCRTRSLWGDFLAWHARAAERSRKKTTSSLDPHTDLDRGVLVATVGRFRRVATVGLAASQILLSRAVRESSRV